MANGHLTGAQVLDQLEHLARVEHALVVEHLSVSCALGHDLAADEGGATTKQGRDAASTAASLAVGDMFHLKRLVQVLVDAGRPAELGRADSIPGASSSVGGLPWARPTAAELREVVHREEQIARAVDELYQQLGHRLSTATDLDLDDSVLDQVRGIVKDAATHADGVGALRDLLGDLSPDDFLRATRREPRSDAEQRLLDLSDRMYGLTLALLRERFAPKSFMGPTLAVSAMEGLDGVNRLLVDRGLLPPFTL